jgi:antitoxin HigA-1
MMSKSATTTKIPPVHPGEILAEDLKDAGMSMNQLAIAIGVPMNRISAIVNGRRSISGDTALRLARFWGTTPQYWMNLQMNYEIAVADEALGARLARIKPRKTA